MKPQEMLEALAGLADMVRREQKLTEVESMVLPDDKPGMLRWKQIHDLRDALYALSFVKNLIPEKISIDVEVALRKELEWIEEKVNVHAKPKGEK